MLIFFSKCKNKIVCIFSSYIGRNINVMSIKQNYIVI